MDQNRIRRYIEFAIRVANRAPLGQQFRMGCVIARGIDPISFGFNNMKKTHPRSRRFDFPFIHAEIAALIGISERDLWGSIAFVARVRKKTRTGLAKPCSGCEMELRRSGVKRVWFTTDTEDLELIEL